MTVFAVRLNADPRPGRPYSAYPTQKEYAVIHGKAVGNGFHEAVNFLEESGRIRGYLPPKPARELQRAETFTLVSLTYKGDKHKPDHIFGIQANCRFVGANRRINPYISDLEWHFVCNAKDSILFPQGIQNAYAELIGDNPAEWYRGGPTKRIDEDRFRTFVSSLDPSQVESRGAERLEMYRSRYLGRTDLNEISFDDQVAAALKTDLRGVKGNPTPGRRWVPVPQFIRDPKVVAFALKRAGGKCELCKNEAPFLSRKDGTPFLEVHHKITLASGGPDVPENTLALCPNCHRKAHYG